MLFEASQRPDRRADFESSEVADDRDAANIAMLLRHNHDRDRIAVLVVDKQDLIEDALDRLGRLNRLCHGNRITRDGGGVQLMRRAHQQVRLNARFLHNLGGRNSGRARILNRARNSAL